MTNAEAIHVINQVRDVITKNPSWTEEARRVVNEVADMAIKALESQEWIPCKERLPEVAHSVLFSRRSMDTSEGCLQADGKWWQYRWNEILNADQVTAWMPLPDPYKP